MIGLRAKTPLNGQSEPQETADGFQGHETRLGDVLRGERATLGKSLLDVQRELRIRASYIAAIENCDIAAFDAPSFISGYVRSYARYLKMDPDWVFRQFCAESGFEPIHGMAAAASGPKPSRRPADPAEALANPHALFIPQPESIWANVEPRAIGSLAVLLLLAGGLGYGGWSVLQELQRVNLTPGDQAPGVIATLDPVDDAAALVLPADDALAVQLPQPESLDRIYRPQTLEVPVLTARDGPISAIDPGLPAPADVELANATPTIAEPAATALAASGRDGAAAPVRRLAASEAMAYGPQLDTAGLAVRTTAPDAPELELLAVRPAWVRVSSADGTVILEKTMDAGERFALPKLEEPSLLRTGNSGAIYFAVSGRTYGPAAPGPQVVKNLELSPAALTSRYAFADLDKDEDLRNVIAVAAIAPEDAGQGADAAE